MRRYLLLLLAFGACECPAAPMMGCSPSQTQSQPVATSPSDAAAPVTDAGVPSCTTVCGNLDTKLHCSDMWPGSTCVARCKGVTARLPLAKTRACWAKATTCASADACAE